MRSLPPATCGLPCAEELRAAVGGLPECFIHRGKKGNFSVVHQTVTQTSRQTLVVPDCEDDVSAAEHQTRWQPFGSRWPHLPTGTAHTWPNRWGPADCSRSPPGSERPFGAPALQGSVTCPGCAGACNNMGSGCLTHGR